MVTNVLEDSPKDEVQRTGADPDHKWPPNIYQGGFRGYASVISAISQDLDHDIKAEAMIR